MGHLPVTTYNSAPSAANLLPVENTSESDSLAPQSLFSTLRRAVSERSHQPEEILSGVAHAARILTAAQGVAIALAQDGAVTCKVTSGSLCPPTGSSVDVSSGISGTCFRSGKSLICDNTQADDRVDPQLCRTLGIRSIAVVPVQVGSTTLGIMEAFSSEPGSFGDDSLKRLEELAGIAAATVKPEPAPVTENSERKASFEPSRRSLEVIEARRAQIRREILVAPVLSSDAQTNSRSQRFWFFAGIATITLLISTIAWFSWHASDDDIIEAQLAAEKQPAQPKTNSSASSDSKPSASISQAIPEQHDSKTLVKNAAHIESESVRPVLAISIKTPGTLPTLKNASNNNIVITSPIVSTAPTAQISNVIVPATPSLPTLDTPISQGFLEGPLIRRVQPSYPPLARAQRIEGPVVLDVSVGEDGRPHQIKPISGDPMLVPSAVNAVSQWRYRPSLLNGKPVAVKKQITLLFNAH